MKVKTKLFLLTCASLVSFVLAAGVYFALMTPVNTIESEKRYIDALNVATLKLEIEINRLDMGAFDTQKALYDEALKNYQAAFANLDKVVILPSINEEMAGAVTAVRNLDELSKAGLDSLESSFSDLVADAQKAFSTSKSITLTSLFAQSFQQTDNNTNGVINYHVSSFQDLLSDLQEIMSTSSKSIENNISVIDGEVDSIKTQTYMVVITVLAIIAGLLVTVSFIVARSITRTLSLIQARVAAMSNGDLRGRFNTNRKDEVGILGRQLDVLLEMLNRSLGKTKMASFNNIRLKDELSQAVSESTSSAVEIEAHSDSIRNRMESMDGMIQGADGNIDRIAKSIATFTNRINEQNHHIEESVSAVTQMLASLENVTRITEQDRESAAALVSQAEQGREVFENSFERIEGITESIELVQEMASVIANVASQTNLLAMNAAIEAAHAGEFGKGFAVVADEIGKLASASAESSKEIGSTIRTITDAIHQAVATKEDTQKAFNSITSKITEVSDSITEIHHNIQEMQVGSRQVLESMNHLRLTSSEITRESGDINSTTNTVASSFADISRVSHEVAVNIGEIATGLKDINRSVHRVSEHSFQIGEIGRELVTSVEGFSTDDDAQSENGITADSQDNHAAPTT